MSQKSSLSKTTQNVSWSLTGDILLSPTDLTQSRSYSADARHVRKGQQSSPPKPRGPEPELMRTYRGLGLEGEAFEPSDHTWALGLIHR